MAFKIDLTPPFQAELDSVSGGFINKYPFRRRRRPRKLKAPISNRLRDLIMFGMNKGGLVSRNRKKKCKYF